jgi:hypothetical protein
MSPKIKSFRIDDDLIERSDLEPNFSTMANQAIREHYSSVAWLPNLQIEQHAGIPAAQVVSRTEIVEHLRFSESTIYFTFYPTSKKELARNKSIHAYANGDYNTIHDGFVYFNIQFPVDFLLFLKSRPWTVVERAIHGFLALLYMQDEQSQAIMEDQLEKSTLQRVLKLFNQPAIRRLTEYQQRAETNGLSKANAAVYDELFFRTLIEVGIDPLLFPYVQKIIPFIEYPISFKRHIKKAENDFNLKLPAGYMRDVNEETDDWQSIVVKGNRKDDGLIRAESKAEPWNVWIKYYRGYHGIFKRTQVSKPPK